MIQAIPIEFGLLKSIECLHIDANYFTEIPTTFCYLKHLSDLAFEWLEFLDPPFQKNIKENIGKTIISLIRNSLQEMVKQNILFCDFSTFIEKNSNNTSRKDLDKINNENTNNINNNMDSLNSSDFNENKRINSKALNTNENIDMEKNLKKVNSYKDRVNNSITKEGNLLTLSNIKNTKFFYAIDNNYYGVIKSILFSNCEITKIKNIDNKTPLYYSIHHNKVDITNLFLTKVDLFNISNAYIYLHKAIRMRDPILTMKLIDLGVDPNNADDQGINLIIILKKILLGTTCFHVLFSSFTKNLGKCSLIGDILLNYCDKINSLNNDFWAPIHIASRRASKECLLWILKANKILAKTNRENFDLNLMVII